MRGTTEPRAWLVRGPKSWACDQWTLDDGYTAVDFSEVGDMSPTTIQSAMRDQLAPAMPGTGEAEG